MFVLFWLFLLFPALLQRILSGWVAVDASWGIVRYADSNAREAWLEEETEDGKTLKSNNGKHIYTGIN